MILRETYKSSRIVVATLKAISMAAQILRLGGLVAFPTETVYGLGADARNNYAVATLFISKKRPKFNPLIVHIPSLEDVSSLIKLGYLGERLANYLWPGPLTLVSSYHPNCWISQLATSTVGTLAVRIPDHPIALAFLVKSVHPVVAPSANLSGTISSTTSVHVAKSLSSVIDIILDGGPCQVGIESTVLDVSVTRTATLLRLGGIETDIIEHLIGPLGHRKKLSQHQIISSPGMLNRHYAPSIPLKLNVCVPIPGEALLGFGQVHGAILNLSPSSNLKEAASNLFSMLWTLDRPEFTAISVSPIPMFGLGIALNDRLHRAASERL